MKYLNNPQLPYIWPSTYGTSGQTLQTDGTGQLAWGASSGFSGYSGLSGFSGYSGRSGFSGYSGMFGGDSHPYSIDTAAGLPEPVSVASGSFLTAGEPLTSVSFFYFSTTNGDGVNIASWLLALDDSTNPIDGRLRIVNRGNSAIFYDYNITAIFDGTADGYVRVSVTYVAGTGTLNSGDKVIVSFCRAGDSGFSGYSGTSGFSGYSGRSGFSGYSGASGISGFSGYSGPTWAESSPAQITSNQNDYSFTAGTSLLRLSCDADGRKITGLAGGVAGKVLFIRNVGTKELLFAHQSSSSSAANRLILPYPVDFVLRPDDTYEFVYDDTTDRWVMVGGYDAFLKDERYCSYMFDDFISGSLSTSGTMGSLGWTQTGAGTITRTNMDSSTQGRPGNIYLQGSSGQDKAVYMTSYTPATSDQLIFSCSVRLPTSLSDGTNTYHVSFGWAGQLGTTLATINSLIGGGTPPTLVVFEYNHTVSANWLYATTSAFNGTGAETSTGIAAAADTWTRFDIVYRPGVPNAEFFINAASVGTETTAGNLPDLANGDNFLYGGFYYYKSAGASARWFHIDYARMLNIRTTKR